MNDLDLLKGLPGKVDPPDRATRDRMRGLMEARIASGPSRRTKPAMRASMLAIAAVLAVGGLAAAVTGHFWTRHHPVALPIEIGQNPVSSPAELASTVAEFAPAIRLPAGGSFEQWSQRFSANTPGWMWKHGGVRRSEVATDMVVVSECQWAQQWLDSSAQSNHAGARQALKVLSGVNRWLHAAGSSDNGYMASLIDQMRKGDSVGIQSFENGDCSYMGAWGTAPAQEDSKAKADLSPAIRTAQKYLRGGGDSGAFDPSKAHSLEPNINWSSSHEQPVPARPGAIFIAQSAGLGVTIVSVSESGTQFCVVVTDSAVVHGTTNKDLSVVPDGDGARAKYPGPVICTPGGW